MKTLLESEIKYWAKEQFNGADFSDKRRVNRVINIAENMASNPGKSIPQLCETFYDVKATYNIFKHEESTPDRLQKGHRSMVIDKINKSGEYLLIEDTSEISWSGKDPIEGLGPIGQGSSGLQGFFLQSVLAVEWDSQELNEYIPLKIIGLLDQQYYIRKKKKTKTQPIRRRHSTKELETNIWEKTLRRLPKPSSAVRWVRVCDRGADIYEVLKDSLEKGFGFVIRAQHNRILENKKNIFQALQESNPIGKYTLNLRSRKNQKFRQAKLSISTEEIQIKSPQRPGYKRGKPPSIKCSAIRVWEEKDVKNTQPIEWYLLTDKKITSFEEALLCVKQYSRRWLIEEFHKALKMGLGAEKLQLEHANRLFAAIAIMSVIALRLIKIRDDLRINPDKPAEECAFSELELKILTKVTNRKIKTQKDIGLAIGRLGGHLNRKRDGMPGMITLWRGMQKLLNLIEGVQLANSVM